MTNTVIDRLQPTTKVRGKLGYSDPEHETTRKLTRRQRGVRAGRPRSDNVTLNFDLLTPKPNQFIFVPRCTNDKSWAKIYEQILEISRKHSLGRTDGGVQNIPW